MRVMRSALVLAYRPRPPVGGAVPVAGSCRLRESHPSRIEVSIAAALTYVRRCHAAERRSSFVISTSWAMRTHGSLDRTGLRSAGSIGSLATCRFLLRSEALRRPENRLIERVSADPTLLIRMAVLVIALVVVVVTVATVIAMVFPDITWDEAGILRLFRQFSTPGGLPSHVSVRPPAKPYGKVIATPTSRGC
jgi:XFP N-terminal domain